MPIQIEVRPIEPDASTQYLVGPEGLVWVQPAIGEPVILAARTEEEQQGIAAHVGELLRMGLVPYGMPLNQRVIVAMFGGSPLRECRWVHWADAPAPQGDEGDTMPTQAVVVVVDMPDVQRTSAEDDLITLVEAAKIANVTIQAIAGRIDRGDLTAYTDPSAPNPQKGRRLVRRSDVE